MFDLCKGRWICASAKQHSTRSTWVWPCWLLVFEWPKEVDNVLYFGFNWQKDLSFCIQLGRGFISKSRIRVHLDPDVHFLQFFTFVPLNESISREKKKDWSASRHGTWTNIRCSHPSFFRGLGICSPQRTNSVRQHVAAFLGIAPIRWSWRVHEDEVHWPDFWRFDLGYTSPLVRDKMPQQNLCTCECGWWCR